MTGVDGVVSAMNECLLVSFVTVRLIGSFYCYVAVIQLDDDDDDDDYMPPTITTTSVVRLAFD